MAVDHELDELLKNAKPATPEEIAEQRRSSGENYTPGERQARPQAPLASLTEEEAKLLAQFEYHAPTDLQISRIASLRLATKNLALTIHHVVPPGPQRSTALRKLHETLMTANAGVVLGPETWQKESRTDARYGARVG